jgi:hypothetical protein
MTAHLHMQPNVADFKRRALSNIDADEVGRVFVKYVDMP